MTTPAGTHIMPAVRYEKAQTAIAFLCEAFGFERHLVVPGDALEQVHHAQLVLGPRMIMLGSARDHGEFDKHVRMPREAGGCTQSIYVILDEIDQHHARAKAAGAEILFGPEDNDYGGRSYTCKDCEGHLWTFGTYDPWTAEHT